MSYTYIKTETAPAPRGPYSQGVVVGSLVFTAGQLPVDPKSGELVAGEIDEQASRAFENIRAVLEAAGSSLDKVVKLTVLLHDIGDLQGVAEVRRRYWSDPHPISTTFQAGRLPMEGALLEVEAMAVL